MHDALSCLYCQFPEALIAGMLISVVCSLFGVFVILKRAVFIGITLSEVAGCGVAMSMLWGFAPFLGAAVLVLAAVSLLAAPLESQRIPRDTLLGVVFIAASALTVLLVSRSGSGLQEVQALLYGDLILASRREVIQLMVVLGPSLILFLVAFRPVLYSFLDRDSARVMGIRVLFWEMLFFLLLGLVIAAASRIGGALLIFCYMVVCPATALVLSRRIGVVSLLAPVVGAGATLMGMSLSFQHDLPTNQTICIVCCALFVGAAGAKWLAHRFLVKMTA
jgi:ABC-type Mn2+/Zn2+ transport system permease subunit